MKNRKLLLIVSLVLALTMSLGGTLAYLTDTDADINVMVLGNVNIVQNEQMRDENGTLVAYENKPALPAVYETITWDAQKVTISGGEFKFFDSEMKNVNDKIVTVTNKGNTPAYVRTIIAIEAPAGFNDELVHVNINGSQGVTKSEWKYVTTDAGVRYVYSIFTYTNALAAKTTSLPSLLQVFLDKTVDNEHIAALGDDWEIIALSQAVQADGFSSAAAAFKAAFDNGDDAPSDILLKGWLTNPAQESTGDANMPPVYEDPKPANGDDDSVTYDIPENAIRVTSASELVQKVNEGETIFLLADGEYDLFGCAGKTLTLYGESKNTVLTLANEGEYGMDYAFDGASVDFYGLTFDTTGMQNANWPGYARLINASYNNCEFKGSYSPVAGTHTFNYCTFDITANSYNSWIYGANTVKFDHCTFNCNIKAIYADGAGGIDLTVENCLFNDTDSTQGDKAAIETGYTYTTTNKINVVVNNVTVNGFSVGKNTETTLWANKDNKGTDQLNVVVDGVDVY